MNDLWGAFNPTLVKIFMLDFLFRKYFDYYKSAFMCNCRILNSSLDILNLKSKVFEIIVFTSLFLSNISMMCQYQSDMSISAQYDVNVMIKMRNDLIPSIDKQQKTSNYLDRNLFLPCVPVWNSTKALFYL